MPNNPIAANKLNRRKFTKIAAGSLLGAGLVSGTKPVRAADYPQEWTKTHQPVTDTENQVNHASVLRLHQSEFDDYDNEWDHEFHFTNQGVGTEANDTSIKRNTINSSTMAIKDATDDLSVAHGATPDMNAMWPADSGLNDWGEGVTASLSAVATLTGNIVLAGTLSATGLAQALLNVADDGNGYIFYKQEGYSGINECAQHLYILVKDPGGGPFISLMTLRSDVGISQIDWSVFFNIGGGVNPLSVSPAGDDKKIRSRQQKTANNWGNPREMSAEEQNSFGVEKLLPADVNDVETYGPRQRGKVFKNGKAINISERTLKKIEDRGEVFVSTNPPISASAIASKKD